jgi:5'-nucleotidase
LKTCDLIPDAHSRSLRELSARFEIYIATQAMAVPNSLGPKYRWLQRHFPFVPPDALRLLRQQVHPPRRLPHRRPAAQYPSSALKASGLLYTAPHNLAATGYVRVDNWLDR